MKRIIEYFLRFKRENFSIQLIRYMTDWLSIETTILNG